MSVSFDQPNSGLLCLVLVLRHYQQDVTPESLVHKYTLTDEPIDPALMLRIVREHGFKSKLTTLTSEKLFLLGEAYPVIALLNDGRYIILSGVRGAKDQGDIAYVDPASGVMQFQFWTREQLDAVWDGKIIFLKKEYSLTDEEQPFGLSWFIPEMFRQKKVFRDIALATLATNVLSLSFPMYMQIVLDKVVGNQSVQTLTVLSVGLLGVYVIEGLLNYLKRYMLLFATNKMDLRLAKVVYNHMLRLPIDFFDHTPSGVLLKHIAQKDRIREFMTGRVFMSVLDMSILLVLLPLLFFYSKVLTAVVLGIALIIACMMALAMRSFRTRLKTHYRAEAMRNSHLVESVRGIHTIKSLSLEPLHTKTWENSSAKSVITSFGVQKLSAILASSTGFLKQLTGLLIVWIGSTLIFDNELSVGSVVAFQMLGSRVTEPLVQLVSIIHEYQEIGLSVTMLGEIMNRPTERPLSSRGLVLPIAGSISIDRVTFQYAPGAPPALEDVSLHIPQGAVIGVVGRSGSGKSTLTRLIQGLYPVQRGRVAVDGNDLRDIELSHLRRSIGVVLQENFLFQGSVRQNIAAANPRATFEEIVMASRLAGADEFIQRLPQGYDTAIVEGGANLSGGQRQRMAIARALLMQPRILILDEATSALDAESESIIQANLAGIAHGRTMIIVSHRLSMLASAHSIVVLDQGKLIANAPHHELLRTCRLYADLWHKQNRHIVSASLNAPEA
ncbi:Toxin RTX-I translocation ATP-binding protein [Fundidesulfovibrio magnetotacticus]|uniref:Toxin RTX-I translocation ATP-binding protein n=1 Tax=Fundidesulfovibrio magnetotacticus TaxID=2730080 RepID=A0A6V8LKN1_9BACT|nr:peptidase domain-containing ABC transporter [Fundidesulfovibrio magnetotacticus]GFK92234.1 Toxin RTX-I translocation ATP-binding protein [Fundidesulfovibrio magnetotacticus]